MKTKPPMTLEVDRDSGAVYFRIKNGKIAKTRRIKGYPIGCVADFNANGDILGFEYTNVHIKEL